MLDNYKSIPLLAGVSILLLFPVGIGAFTYSALNDRESNSQSELLQNPDFSEDTEIQVVPIPSDESLSGGGNPESTSEIPLGKYSNPPTTIETGRGITDSYSRSRNTFDSSVDRNSLRQQTNIDTTPDYSAPAASNGYKSPTDNSLVAPLEDDTFLKVPENEAESAPLSPMSEPLPN
ncbi:MAG: hypothetical protein AAFQ41_11860 [Cyanobacteria bacterium J06623_7]